MKKILILLLTLCMVLTFAACDEGENDDHVHAYTSAVTTTATCAEKGVTTFTCPCGDSYTEEIAATGQHDWSNWKLETSALIGKPGTEKRVCSACSASETRERTANAIPNSFYDSSLQYIFLYNGEISCYSLLDYARHEFHDYIYTATPSVAIFDELSKRFNVTDALKAEMLQAGIDETKSLAQYPGAEGSYGYNQADDTFTLSYNAESGNFRFLGYVHNEGKNYTAYFARSDFGFEETPETIWKVELEYNKIDGTPNKYLSFKQVTSAPDDITACPVDEMSEFIG